MAAVWKVPVVFVVENNLYGEYSPIRDTTPLDDLADRAKAYAMPGVIVDGQDVDAVHEAVAAAIAARACGRRADADRGEDVPLPRPLAHRPGQVSAPRASSSAGRSATRSTSLGGLLAAEGHPERGRAARPARRGPVRRRRGRSRAAEAPIPTLEETRTMSTHLETEPVAARDRRHRRSPTARRSTPRSRTSWSRSGGRPHGGGRRHRRRRLQDERGAAGEVRPGAHPQHADLRERLHRRRARDGRDGHAAGGRDHVQRLPAHGGRRDRERAAEVPLHVGRAVRRAGDGALDGRGDGSLRHAALRDRRVVVHRPAGPQGRDGRRRRPPRTASCVPRSATTTPCWSSSTRASTAARARFSSASRGSCRSARPGSSARAPTSPSLRRC